MTWLYNENDFVNNERVEISSYNQYFIWTGDHSASIPLTKSFSKSKLE